MASSKNPIIFSDGSIKCKTCNHESKYHDNGCGGCEVSALVDGVDFVCNCWEFKE